MKNLTLVLCLLIINSFQLFAQDFKNTISIEGEVESPPAKIESIQWLAGHWRGEAFGGITEEVWTPPVSGGMMCVFKSVVDDTVRFYEIVTITEEGGTLIKQLRHFNPDLKGWEEKDSPLIYKLIKVEDNRIYFNGFTYEKVNENEINIYVILKQRDGTESEMKFNYTKIR